MQPGCFRFPNYQTEPGTEMRKTEKGDRQYDVAESRVEEDRRPVYCDQPECLPRAGNLLLLMMGVMGRETMPKVQWASAAEETRDQACCFTTGRYMLNRVKWRVPTLPESLERMLIGWAEEKGMTQDIRGLQARGDPSMIAVPLLGRRLSDSDLSRTW